MYREVENMMRINYLKKKFQNGEKTIGTWCVIDSPMVTDIISSSNLDFVIIDMEHGPISYETAQAMVMVCESHQVSPVIRVGKLDEHLILRALDVGAHGVQVPNISTAEDAKLFVKLSKYPPLGERGFSPYTKAGLYDFKNGKALTKKANENTLLIANVEGTEGIKNLDGISKVEHIDVIFIGLFDLSKSLGIPGDVENPRLLTELKNAVKIVHSKGKKIGCVPANRKMLEEFISLGIDYVTYSVDSGVLKEGYSSAVELFRK